MVKLKMVTTSAYKFKRTNVIIEKNLYPYFQSKILINEKGLPQCSSETTAEGLS